MSTNGAKPPRLDPREHRFALAYFANGGNGVEAAREAGYSDSSYRALGVQANRLLKRRKILQLIADHEHAAAAAAGVTFDRVVRELARIAFADLREVAEWHEDMLKLIPSGEISTDAARALKQIVSTVSQTEFGTTKRLQVQTHDKMGALKILSGMFPQFTQAQEVKVTGLAECFEEIAAAARERREAYLAGRLELG